MTTDELRTRIRTIHTKEVLPGVNGGTTGQPICGECFRNWPCPTIQALATEASE